MDVRRKDSVILQRLSEVLRRSEVCQTDRHRHTRQIAIMFNIGVATIVLMKQTVTETMETECLTLKITTEVDTMWAASITMKDPY